jgi:hypothetical protein
MKKILLLSSLAASLVLAFPFPVKATDKTKVSEASVAVVQEAPLRAHLALISSDSFEGRGTIKRVSFDLKNSPDFPKPLNQIEQQINLFQDLIQLGKAH